MFVSSTCYDLIDLRAELEEELRQLGLTPVMSDQPSAEFEVLPNQKSIETCLANLRTCQVVLLVLCQRYGPSLEKAGYEAVSATHLEYRTAIEAKIPVFVYLRDRLVGDYTVWQRSRRNPADSGQSSFAWVRSKRDEGLFGLIDEHAQLNRGADRSNWWTPFRDSREHKKIVRRDLQRESAEATLRQLVSSGQVPWLALSLGRATTQSPLNSDGTVLLLVELSNHGQVPAFDVELSIQIPGHEDSGPAQYPVLAGGQSMTVPVDLPAVPLGPVSSEGFQVRCTCRTATGHRLSTSWTVGIYLESPERIRNTIQPSRWRFHLGSSLPMDLVEPDRPTGTGQEPNGADPGVAPCEEEP